MIRDILNYFGFSIAELLPLDGRIHFEFMHYYFKYPVFGSDSMLIIYASLFVGMFLYFIRDILKMLLETLKAIRLLLLGRATIISACIELKMLNMLLTIIAITVVYYPVAMFASKYKFSMYLSCALMIISAIILRLSEVFTVIKMNGRIFGFKETGLLAAAQILSVIPGFSRVTSMMAIGKFMGSERKHLANMVLLSFLPVVAVQCLAVNPDINYIIPLLISNWKIFVIIAGLTLLSLDVITIILSSPSFYKFYYYIAGVAAWTILDLFFSKRGL